ncbi:MAG: Cache 3/Cache 2 fusion domain-containing protein [Clostridium sp.]
MNIKSKLIISYIFLITFSLSVLGFIIGTYSKNAIFKEVTEKSDTIVTLLETTVSVRDNFLSENLSSNLHLVQKLISNYGTPSLHKNITNDNSLPKLYIGNTELYGENHILNEISSITNTLATFFVLDGKELVAVSSTLNEDPSHELNLYKTSSRDILKKILNKECYYGQIKIEDEWFLSVYQPLLDNDNNVIGAFSLGYTSLDEHLENTLSSIRIGDTGYVYIMNSQGYLISHPNKKNQSLSQEPFVKDIIGQNNGQITYEFEGEKKISSFKYFEEWDWYIVSVNNYIDLRQPSIFISSLTILVGVIVFIIGSLIAYFLADTLVKPINKLKACIEEVSKGNLDVSVDLKNKDELGVLASSFNIMISENKLLVDKVVQNEKVKTEFFSNISHELKTPLNIIFSTAQLFKLYTENNDLSLDKNKLISYTATIKQNCYRLLRLVNNLIDLTKIDSGFMQLNLKNENIVEVVENISLSTVNYVESLGRSIIFDTDTEEKILAIDSEKMECIILNLISNATKFTKPGDSIDVAIYDQDDFVKISIKDSGGGIPNDKLDSIFERFKQVDPLLSRRHEGSGIGLYLIKSLIELHNGTISVISELDVGTEFIILLPVTFVDNNDDPTECSKYTSTSKVEKIQIEFSDIYS